MRTGLVDPEAWKSFPEELFTPISQIVKGVLMLIDGKEMADSKGKKIAAGQGYGLALEINGQNFYFRDQPEWCDNNMKTMMLSTDVEHQTGSLLNEKN